MGIKCSQIVFIDNTRALQYLSKEKKNRLTNKEGKVLNCFIFAYLFIDIVIFY